MKEFKKGQTAWSSTDGEVEIIKVDSRVIGILECARYCYLDGRLSHKDKHPTLFHSKRDMIDYFIKLKEKKTYTRWINLYADGMSVPHRTEKEARDSALRSVCETREITWTVFQEKRHQGALVKF